MFSLLYEGLLFLCSKCEFNANIQNDEVIRTCSPIQIANIGRNIKMKLCGANTFPYFYVF